MTSLPAVLPANPQLPATVQRSAIGEVPALLAHLAGEGRAVNPLDTEAPAVIGPNAISLSGGLEPATAGTVAAWCTALLRTAQRLPRLRAIVETGKGRKSRAERISRAAEIEQARMKLAQTESDLRHLLAEGWGAMALAAANDRWGWDTLANYVAGAARMDRRQLDKLAEAAGSRMRSNVRAVASPEFQAKLTGCNPATTA